MCKIDKNSDNICHIIFTMETNNTPVKSEFFPQCFDFVLYKLSPQLHVELSEECRSAAKVKHDPLAERPKQAPGKLHGNLQLQGEMCQIQTQSTGKTTQIASKFHRNLQLKEEKGPNWNTIHWLNDPNRPPVNPTVTCNYREKVPN